MEKNAVELVQNQKSVGFFSQLFLVPKPNNKWRPILDLSKKKSFPQGGKIQNGGTGNYQDFPPTKRVGDLNRFQGHLLPHINTRTVQEISEISCRGSDIPVQSSALWSVHSTHGVYCSSEGSKTDGHTQGYKNPPVPRRLVGESQVPPNLSPAYQKSSENVSRPRLASECRKMRAGTQASLRLCRLPVWSQVQSGPTRTGPVAEPSRKDTVTASTSGLSGPAVHIPDRFANSYRKASSPRSTTLRPIQWHLKNNWRVPESLVKVSPIPRSLNPHLQWWLEEGNVLQGQPLHPVKHVVQIFSDASKEGWGAHLKNALQEGPGLCQKASCI